MFLEKGAESFEQASMLEHLFGKNESKNWREKMNPDQLLACETWKGSFSISREMIDDRKSMDLKNKPQAFLTSYYRIREMFGAALFEAAIAGKKNFSFRGKIFDASTADNLALFDKAHPSVIEGVGLKQSNQFKDAFSAEALRAMKSVMQDFRGDNEEILAVVPDTILIPNEYKLKKSVFEAIGADKDPAAPSDRFRYQFGHWNVIVWQYLNQFIAPAVKPWILLDSKWNKENGGAVWFDCVKLKVTSSLDRDTNGNIWDGHARFVADFNDWRAFAIGGISGGSALLA